MTGPLGERLQAGLPGSLASKELSDLEYEREYADAFSGLTGVPVAKQGTVVKAGKWVTLKGRRWRYSAGAGAEPIPLAQAYAAHVSGRADERNLPELARWTRRLLIDADLVRTPALRISAPPGAPAHVRKVLPVIASIVRTRLLVDDRDPFPLNNTFVSDWSGGAVTPSQARRAKEWLEAAGVLRRAREQKTARRKGTVLWELVETGPRMLERPQ